EAVLVRLQHARGQLGVRGDRGGEQDRVQGGILEQLRELPGDARARERGRGTRARIGARIAQPAQLAARDGGEVAGEVGSPVAESHDPHALRRALLLAGVRGGIDLVGPCERAAHRAPTACTQRSAACPSPYSCGLSPGGWRASAASAAAASRSTSVFQPAATVSTHSVSARSVMQGTPARYASFWTPPESVRTALACTSRALNSPYPSGSVTSTRPSRCSSRRRPSSSRRARVRGC